MSVTALTEYQHKTLLLGVKLVRRDFLTQTAEEVQGGKTASLDDMALQSLKDFEVLLEKGNAAPTNAAIFVQEMKNQGFDTAALEKGELEQARSIAQNIQNFALENPEKFVNAAVQTINEINTSGPALKKDNTPLKNEFDEKAVHPHIQVKARPEMRGQDLTTYKLDESGQIALGEDEKPQAAETKIDVSTISGNINVRATQDPSMVIIEADGGKHAAKVSDLNIMDSVQIQKINEASERLKSITPDAAQAIPAQAAPVQNTGHSLFKASGNGVAAYDFKVAELQQALIERDPKFKDTLKYQKDGQDVAVDGREGPRTRAAVEQFAKDNHINLNDVQNIDELIEKIKSEPTAKTGITAPVAAEAPADITVKASTPESHAVAPLEKPAETQEANSWDEEVTAKYYDPAPLSQLKDTMVSAFQSVVGDPNTKPAPVMDQSMDPIERTRVLSTANNFS